MKKIKKFGALTIGAIFLYDFLVTLSLDSNQAFNVIGLEVSKITYLAYLLAIAVSFLTYGFTKQTQKRDSANQPISDND